MKMILKLVLVLLFMNVIAFSQNQHMIMTYNLLNYPGSDTTIRNPNFRTIFSNIQPDILVVQEMTSQAGVTGFLNNVLNKVSSGYAAGEFINGPDTDNAIFYRNSLFTFISNTPIKTALRDINEFKLVNNATGDTLRIYSLHLKASSGSSNEFLRAAEIDSLRKHTQTIPAGSSFIVLGDYNIYGSTESAYQKLLNQDVPGYFLDLFTLNGNWNQEQFSVYHTQSPRVRQFGGGATGGMDDRFDLILMSQTILDEGGITYLPGSYTVYGNDGNHFNDSINRPPNTAVGQTIANALHDASDHLPVYANFSFASSSPQQILFTALIEGMYNGISMNPDTVTIELRDITPSHSLIEQTQLILNSNGQGVCNFFTTSNATPYYIVVKHRNSLETWSATSQIFSNGTLSYDFTSSSDKAFGNNLKLINGKWCIYSGDVNQDGFIETADVSAVFINGINVVTGFTSTDLNGDLITDEEDISIVFQNNILGRQIKSPVSSAEKSK